MTACTGQSLALDNGTIMRDFEICKVCRDKPCVNECPYDALSLTGREIMTDELMDCISRDIPFYRNSGGGVTFSGGEPFHQPAFLTGMLKRCKESGIHTAVETCGWTTQSVLLGTIPLVDLFLFDLKIIDPEKHLRYTGKPVGPILENLALLASVHPEIVIRFPLIPVITDTRENLTDILNVMKQNKLTRIGLEPYHSLGVEKYAEHGLEYTYSDVKIYESEDLETAKLFFEGHGISAEIV